MCVYFSDSFALTTRSPGFLKGNAIFVSFSTFLGGVGFGVNVECEKGSCFSGERHKTVAENANVNNETCSGSVFVEFLLN